MLGRGESQASAGHGAASNVGLSRAAASLRPGRERAAERRRGAPAEAEACAQWRKKQREEEKKKKDIAFSQLN